MSMRKSILTLFLVLLSASWAMAQYGEYGRPYGQRHHGGIRLRVAGCLYGDNGYLTLFDDNGNTYAISGPQAARLSRFVGHRVRVEGRSFFDPDNPNAMAGNEGEAVPTLRVFEIEHVSPGSCAGGWGYESQPGFSIHIP